MQIDLMALIFLQLSNLKLIDYEKVSFNKKKRPMVYA